MNQKENKKTWKVLESEYLIKRPWLTARRDCVELPDGRTIPEYYVLEYPDWVNVIAITKEGRFVMEEQYRHAAGKVSCELPCGVMEAGGDSARSCQAGTFGRDWIRQRRVAATDGVVAQSGFDVQYNLLFPGNRCGENSGTLS